MSHWFKHYNNAHEGHSIQSLLAVKNYEAIVAYWIICELISKFSKPGNPGKMTIPMKLLARKLNMSCPKVERILGQLSSNLSPTFIHELDTSQEQVVSIFLSNWSELQTSWGGKRGARFEQESGRYKITDKDTELDTETEVNTVQPAKKLPAPKPVKKIIPERSGVAEVREAFFKAFHEEFGREPAGWGAKENAMCSNWLKSVSKEKAILLASVYPKWNDPWVTKNGHPFGILVAQYNSVDAWFHNPKTLIKKIAAGRAVESIDVKEAVKEEEQRRADGRFLESKLQRNPTLGRAGLQAVPDKT